MKHLVTVYLRSALTLKSVANATLSQQRFAIAITLLVLEIRLPEQNETAASLACNLLSLLPSFFAYILSFVMIGSYWINHHYIFKIYQRTDRTFNLLNVLETYAVESILPP